MADYHSKVDTSRPIRSVKEALAIFGEKVLVGETYEPKQSISPDRESTYYSPGSQRYTCGDDHIFDDALKKLEAELWETKMELTMLGGRESETEEAVFSSNGKLQKNMSSLALDNADAAAKASAMENSEEDIRDFLERTRSSAHAVSIGEKEDLLDSKKKKKNVMKKHIILLVGNLFPRKKRSSTTNLRIEDKTAAFHPTTKKE
ncbi:hypothetical protein LIER_31855 [Lithospermum erythrorhizon]|uniref:Uncharacterized protein n=1 Tax=Lithospermum erythrorhizon TaxID=34254 RepID=A0AAV3RT74_LITER